MNRLLESWTGLTLAHPWAFGLALLVILAAFLGARRPAIRFAPAGFLRLDADGRRARLPRSLRQRTAWLPRTLTALGLLSLVVAFARPQERVPLPLEREGLDILLCIDASSSMAADDLRPGETRLAITKAAAAEFIAAREDDRIGLVTFARYPDLVCPPTIDHRSLAAMLAAVAQVEADGDEDATGLGMAIARCAVALRDSQARSKLVILLTDGEENVARSDLPDEITPLEAARLCEELGVRVYTIAAGIGRQAVGGEWIELDTGPVRRVAERTGGAFFEARDAEAVRRVYAAIDELERSGYQEPRFRREDRFLVWLLVGLGLWLVGRLAAATVWEGLP